jgi:hypothetical protein
MFLNFKYLSSTSICHHSFYVKTAEGDLPTSDLYKGKGPN